MEAELTLEQRILVLAQVYQAIPLYFAHWDDALVSKEQLDGVFAELVREAVACDSRKDFSLLMMAFLARLNNGHTRFRDPLLHNQPPLGMTLRPVEGRWTVIDSHLPAIRIGDVIQQIEGRPIEGWYEMLHPYTVGSPQSRTVQFGEMSPFFAALLGIFLPHRYTVTLENAQGASKTLSVDRTTITSDAPPPRTEGRWLQDNLAYIKVPSFLAPDNEERALTYLKSFADAACLIIDVRDNHGGSTPGNLTRALMDRPYRWWAESSPLNVGALTYQAQSGHNAYMFTHSHLLWHAPASHPDPDGYRGRLLILIDRATYSAAEDFAMPFKDNGRAVLVGEPTGGSTGQPYYHTFDSGLQFAIGTKRAYLPDGAKFEGVGLIPDSHIVARREDLYAGRDPVLEEAMALSRTL